MGIGMLVVTLITVRNLFVTSKKERVVEWVKEVVPRCKPRTILPSFLQAKKGFERRSQMIRILVAPVLFYWKQDQIPHSNQELQ